MSGRGYPVYVSEYLRDWLDREWFAKGHNQVELAKRCGVTKTMVSDFKNRNRNAGYDILTGVARVMGRTRDEIEAEALVWWRARGEDEHVKRQDRFPNRTAALEFLRDEIPTDVAKRIRAINLDATDDPSRSWWVARITSEVDLHRTQKP